MYRILAAFSFFTRLPFWRIANIPKYYYERVVPLWPMIGWFTGASMALIVCSSCKLPITVSVILCLITRILITGALHEDGYADFCDGFGGGTNREHTLHIMKDSHIGTYGVVGLMLYFLLQTNVISGIILTLYNPLDIIATFIIADTFCKWVSSTIIYFLPYARKEEEAKNKLVYAKVTWKDKITSLILGMLPLCIFLPFTISLNLIHIIIACTASIVSALLLFSYMHRRIGGYTGDCCGASFIITEVIFYLALIIVL